MIAAEGLPVAPALVVSVTTGTAGAVSEASHAEKSRSIADIITVGLPCRRTLNATITILLKLLRWPGPDQLSGSAAVNA
jgi:hypothetical protein